MVLKTVHEFGASNFLKAETKCLLMWNEFYLRENYEPTYPHFVKKGLVVWTGALPLMALIGRVRPLGKPFLGFR